MARKPKAAGVKKSKPRMLGNVITLRAAIIVIVLAAVIITLALYLSYIPVKGGEWQSFIGNYNNSRYQSNSTINASNIGAIGQKWFIHTGYSVTSTPLVLNGRVYFADWGGYVYCANLTTGTVIWKENLNPYVSKVQGNTTGISSTLAIADGVIYVGDGLGSDTQPKTNLFALNIANGSLIWMDSNTIFKTSMNSMWGSPTVYDGMVYIGTSGTTWPPVPGAPVKKGSIYALDANNGTEVWNVTMAIGNSQGAGIWSTPVVDPQLNSIYFGTGNAGSYLGTTAKYSYGIVSMNATTGKMNWVYQAYNTTAAGGDFDFGSTANLFSIKLNNVVYSAVGIGNKDGNYYIVNMLNGTLLKVNKIGYGGSGIIGVAGFTYPAPDNPKIFIPSYYKINATVSGAVTAFLPASNTTAWRFYTPSPVVGSVTIIPGAVLFGDDKGNLYAVNASSGTTLFHASFPGTQINTGVTVAEGYLLVGTSFGYQNLMGVYGYSTKT